MTLERAIRELAAGESAFYETVRAAWREHRCAELATAIEDVARIHGRPPIDAATPKAWQAAWVARAREGNPLDLANLLRGLVERAQSRQASMIAACLDELASYTDEPQLTRPLLELLAVEAASSAWNKVQTRIFQLLEAAGDPRVIDSFGPARELAAKVRKSSESMAESLLRCERTRERLLARFPDGVPAAPPGMREQCDELVRTTPETPLVFAPKVDELDMLYQAVLEDPDDDARRAVYADALQQRDDPRGELIALQLAGSPKAARLIEKHRARLLGGIAKAVLASTAVFEKGFLVACETDVRRAATAKVVFTRPEWATVKRLRFRSYGLLSAAMRSLEEAIDVPDGAVAPLRTIVLPKLRVLALSPSFPFSLDGEARGPAGVLAKTTGLPALRELRIPRSYGELMLDSLRWLARAPCMANVEHLVVPAVTMGVLRTYQPLFASQPSLRTIATMDGKTIESGGR